MALHVCRAFVTLLAVLLLWPAPAFTAGVQAVFDLSSPSV